jgi:hypothetical protein
MQSSLIVHAILLLYFRELLGKYNKPNVRASIYLTTWDLKHNGIGSIGSVCGNSTDRTSIVAAHNTKLLTGDVSILKPVFS